MKKNMVLASMALMLSTPTFADTLGVYLGGNVWANTASGTFGESTGQADLGLDDATQGSFFIAFEHPIPLIPNMRISSTQLDTEGSKLLGSSFEFGDETFSSGDSVETEFEASYIDYTLYYELFDNGLFSFDFGITARDFESDITISDDGTTNANVSTSQVIPMVYVATNVGLPFTGFNLYAQGNLLSFDDSTVYDYEAGVSYELVDNLLIDVNLTLGYKAIKLELDDIDNLYSDLDFDGVYAGAVIHF